jgi:hypothetical protein
MYRIGIVLCLVVFGCKEKKSTSVEGNGFSYKSFSELFRPLSLPYQLADTGLLHNRDTAAIHSAEFAQFLSDSIKSKLYGKSAKIKYTALGFMKGPSGKRFYLVKAVSGNRKTALLYVFDGDQFATVFPFLVPDDDPTTSQTSAIDNSLSITKTITQRRPEITAEGKDVYAYEEGSKEFSLILTNPIDGNSELVNPIDTLPRTHKLAGDYIKDKKNFVTVRDGRNPNQLLVFIHVENDEGCSGELKGDLLITSSSSAIYRQGGDPCVLSLRFSGSSVNVKEDEGCGSRRGLNCSFDGTYNRKKQQKTKAAAKKSAR